ncbi:MAG: AEC family transporter [Actinomycetota bacterium]
MSELLTFIPAVIIIIGLGWFLKRTGFLPENSVDIFNKIIIYVSLPALIFLAVQKTDISLSVTKFPLYAAVVMLVCLALSFGLGKLLKFKNSLLGAFLITAAIGNTGYIGFPLTIGLFGQSELVKSIFYDFGTVVVLFTIGIMIAGYFGDPEHKMNVVKEFATFPSVIALVLGLVCNPLTLPHFAATTLEYLSLANVPLVMLTVGLTLESKAIGRYAAPLAAMLAVKLLVSPAIAFLAGTAGGLSGTNLGIVVLEASTPAVMLSLVVGLKYKLDVEFISLAIVVSIIASLATIPAVQALMHLFAA